MRPALLGALVMLAFVAGSARAATVLDPDASYTVKKGDTLYGVAAAHLIDGPSSEAVRKANGVVRPKALAIGKTLRIPGALLRTEPIQAEVTAFSGQVSIDAGTGAAPVKVGMAVGQGALIATGPNAFITLTLPDESRITLPSVSRVRVTRLRRVLLNDAIDRVFTVEAGRTESTVTPMANPNSRYIVDSPVASSAVRGTVFRVAYDPAAGRGATEVVKGVVGTQGGGDEVKVEESFGVAVDATGVSAAVKLLAPPTFRNAGRVQDGAEVLFAAEPSAGAAGYRLQLANDAGFIDAFYEATSPDGSFRLQGVKDGTYFMRATAIDGHGLEGLPKVYSFTRELNVVEGGAAPVAGGDKKVRRFVFRWNASGEGVKTFRFQIFAKTDPSRPLVDQPGLAEKAITLTNLPSGAYAWRVIVSTFRAGRVLLKEGPLQDVEIGQ